MLIAGWRLNRNRPISSGPCVLDASALIAVMLGEAGASVVRTRLKDACISAVNLSEVVAKLAERVIDERAILESIAELGLDVRAFGSAQAQRAGLLRQATRPFGVSFGDRACLALAAELSCPAITTDKAWGQLNLGIDIEVVR